MLSEGARLLRHLLRDRAPTPPRGATFAGHSLRSGLVTTAVKRGVNLMKICDQTGHKSLEMLRVYSRDAELSAGNAAAGLL
jgi:hypothetical protein